MTSARRQQLQRRLRRWYRLRRRPMPWRSTRDPYRIWVSEVMLQQTQVVTALPFYQRFIDRFPTLSALSRAPASAVLAAWAGLGYYRRARHLHQASRIVMREHAGRVPNEPAEFARLPGVGRYTTGAVMSIVFDRPLAALDGNAARVLSRIQALQVSVRDPRGARALWELAEALVPSRAPGDWNQALMELGATICTPRAPRCGDCPVRDLCRARALGRPEAFPPTPVRRATRRVRRAIALIERRGALLMLRRQGPLLDGLWEPPGTDVGSEPSGAKALRSALERLEASVNLTRTGSTIRHRITHREIEVELWRGDLAGPLPRRSGLRWVDPAAPRVAITALARRCGDAIAAMRAAAASARSARASRALSYAAAPWSAIPKRVRRGRACS